MKVKSMGKGSDILDLVFERLAREWTDISLATFLDAVASGTIYGEKVIAAFEFENFGYLRTSTKVYRC